jgi:hypothetical protein
MSPKFTPLVLKNIGLQLEAVGTVTPSKIVYSRLTAVVYISYTTALVCVPKTWSEGSFVT